jgi:phage major capsid protein, HK97 family
MEAKDVIKEIIGYTDEIKGVKAEFHGLNESYEGTKAKMEELNGKMADVLTAVSEVQRRQALGGGQGSKGDLWDLPEVKALGKYIRGQASETKTQFTGSGPSGGFLIAPELVTYVRERLTDVDAIRPYAHVQSVGGGLTQFPVDVDDFGAEWVGELEERKDTDKPTLGLAEIPTNEIQAAIPISKHLIQDGVINVEQYAIGKAIDKFAMSEGASFVTGNGKKKPEGFFTCNKVKQVASGAASTFTADSLIDMWGAVPSAVDRNAAYYVNKRTATHMRKFKDTNGQYLWNPPLDKGAPSTFNGFEVRITPSAPDIAAGETPVVFGDLLNAYTIVDRIDMDVLYDPYTRAGNNKLLYRFNKRVGGGVVQPSGIIKMKIATSV